MRMVNINLQEDVVRQIDVAVSSFGFANRSEFIRSALREKLDGYRMRKALLALESSRGALKGKSAKMTDEEFEKAREGAFWELYSEVKGRPRA